MAWLPKDSTQIRVVLVGLGRMGRNHLRVLSESPLVKLVGVVDLMSPAPEEKLLKGAPFLRDLEAAAKLQTDCVVVATPTETHFEVVEFFLDRGHHVLVEKPVATTAERGQALKQLAEAKGRFLAVGHLERLNPAVRKLKEALDAGWLGDPIHLSFTRVGGYPQNVKEGNNVLLDLAVHDLDVLNFLVGPMKLRASIGHSTFRPDTLDTAEMMLVGAQGASASIHVNWVTPTKIRNLRVTGTKGVAYVDYILQTCEIWGGNLTRRGAEPNVGYPNIVEHYKNTDKIEFGVEKREPLVVQLENLFLALKGEPSLICTANDAIWAVDMAEEAIERANHEF